jgi:hypothetical protein
VIADCRLPIADCDAVHSAIENRQSAIVVSDDRMTRPSVSDRSVLILLNGGKMSRNYLLGLGNSCGRLGINYVFIEIDQVRAAMAQNRAVAMAQLDQILHQHRVAAVISYTLNGCDLPGEFVGGVFRTYFELRGIPHILFWTDHPQWANDKIGLRPDLQVAFRSANCFHFVKTEAHAYELSRVLGWPNCFDCPLACDPDQIKPAVGIEPQYDVVAIYGGQPRPAEWMQPFLELRDPDPQEIGEHFTAGIREELAAMWDRQNVEPALRAQLRALGERLTEYRRRDMFTAAAWHIPALADEFPQAMRWLTFNPRAYFDMVALLWRYRGWHREFILSYLARHFRVAVFGGDWTALGCAKPTSGPGGWVDFQDIPNALARGKVVLNLTAGYDEEGITAKPFEIAASGCAMLHNWNRGLESFFDIGSEIAAFHRPREAVEQVEMLLSDEHRRRAMGEAARARLEREHSWDSRLIRLVEACGFSIESFKPTATAPAAMAA